MNSPQQTRDGSKKKKCKHRWWIHDSTKKYTECATCGFKKDSPQQTQERDWEEVEQILLTDLNLFAMGCETEGYGPELHQEFTKRILERLKPLLSKAVATAKEEERERIIKEIDNRREELYEQHPLWSEHFFEGIDHIILSLSEPNLPKQSSKKEKSK